MRWEDERYVRLYTRDTATWLMVPWQARAVLPLVLRKCDRAGIIDLDSDGLAGLAVMIGLPLEVVTVGVEAWVAKKTIVLADTRLIVPNYLAAQETRSSDSRRKRDQRDRDRAEALKEPRSADAANLNNESHQSSHLVTPSLAVPSRTEPCLEERESAAPPAAGATPVTIALDLEPEDPKTPLGPLALQDLWNTNADKGLPRWKGMSEQRRRAAAARLKAMPLPGWVEVIQRINSSPFLKGQNDRGWRASPDWLLQPDTAARVLEGKYDNTGPPKDMRKGRIAAEDVNWDGKESRISDGLE